MATEVTGVGHGWFAGSDTVGRYWLAHSVGFEIYSEKGRLCGVVAGVELDRASGDTSTLLVHRRRGRPLRFTPASVIWLDPWRRVLIMALPAHPAAAPVHRLSNAALSAGHAAWTRAAPVGPIVAAGVCAARRAARRSRRFATWLGARILYALALAGWLYGATVFVVSRAAVRLLLVMATALLRLGIQVMPPLARAAQTATRRALSIQPAAYVRRLQLPRTARSHGQQERKKFPYTP
jgi:hypothetical protein